MVLNINVFIVKIIFNFFILLALFVVSQLCKTEFFIFL